MVEHLYIHIPFCHRICPYCAFYKHTPGNTQMAAFVQAVLTDAAPVAYTHSTLPTNRDVYSHVVRDLVKYKTRLH